MTMSNDYIFISYRRDDSAGYVRALYDRLIRQFSNEHVFMDVDAIGPGLPFDEAINRALEKCKVLIVVIGRRWIDKQAGIEPRIKDPTDFVHIEIAAALSRKILVVPVLIDGARMPSEKELPEPLRELAKRNALEISNSRFDSDIEMLIKAVRKALGATNGQATLRDNRKITPLLYWLASGLVVGVLGTIAYLYFGFSIQSMRPEINCKWRADVIYDWQNAHYNEEFDLHGEDDEILGTATFLGTKRGILEGSITKKALRFVTKTKEYMSSDYNNQKEQIHHYRGEFLGNEIKFIMQTEGGFSDHIPVKFIAKKVPGTCK